jgi:hypothetical protein
VAKPSRDSCESLGPPDFKLTLILGVRYKTSGHNEDLAWLATRMEQCRTIGIRALCGVLNTSVADMIQYYCVRDYVNKSELIVRIQTGAGGLQGGLSTN